MNIKSNERALFTGKTRSGKTLLATSILINFPKVVFFDPKHQNSNIVEKRKDVVIVTTLKELKSEVRNFWGRRYARYFIVYQPQELDKELFNEFCELMYSMGNQVVAFDEIMQLADGRLQRGHDKLIRMGASRGIGLFTLVQRPMNMSGYVLSENEHIFSFRLILDGDRKKMAGIIGQELADDIGTLEKYHFVYYNLDEGGAIYPPIDI